MKTEALKESLTLLVPTCVAFSDIWKPMSHFLERNWPDTAIVVVSDGGVWEPGSGIEFATSKSDGLNFSQRILDGLAYVKTDYVCLLLDDYFLTRPISEVELLACVNDMKEYGLQYLRFDPTTGSGSYPKIKKGLRAIRPFGPYSANLCPGIWEIKSLVSILDGLSLPPWQLEVKLARLCEEKGINGAYRKKNPIPYLDGVRKGQLLPKAYRYLKKNNLYDGERPVMGKLAAKRNAFRTFWSRRLPPKLRKIYKSFARRRGKTFINED